MISMYPKTMKAQATNGNQHPAAEAAPGGRRIQVRRSGVHGKGVFALKPLSKGEVVIEYKGEVIDWPEALRRHPHDPKDPDHTFYFHIAAGTYICTIYFYMPKDNSIHSVLIIGSGPIIIGQACEFDYSGSQAARSLQRRGPWP